MATKYDIYEQGKAGVAGTYEAESEDAAEDMHARALGYDDSVHRVFCIENAPALYVIPA